MAIIPIQNHIVTRQLKIRFYCKIAVFLALLTWTLNKNFISAIKLSFILFVCFLVMLFFYMIFSQKAMSFGRRALLCVGNFCVLSGLVLIITNLWGML